jgi:Tfp pilus assembly protein PilV
MGGGVKTRGTSIIEALAAVALAGIAVAGLAGAAGVAGRSLRLADQTTAALVLGYERLEQLRAGPRTDGADAPVGVDGTVFARSWSQTGGRGAPASLTVRVSRGAHVVDLATEAMP